MTSIYTLNGNGDLAMDGDIGHYIGQVVEFVKVTKAGLYQVRASDGQLFSVPKRNLTEAKSAPSPEPPK